MLNRSCIHAGRKVLRASQEWQACKANCKGAKISSHRNGSVTICPKLNRLVEDESLDNCIDIYKHYVQPRGMIGPTARNEAWSFMHAISIQAECRGSTLFATIVSYLTQNGFQALRRLEGCTCRCACTGSEATWLSATLAMLCRTTKRVEDDTCGYACEMPCSLLAIVWTWREGHRRPMENFLCEREEPTS